MLQVKILCAIIKTCAVCVSCTVLSDSLQPHGLQPASLLCPWDSPGKSTGVDSHALLQGIFPVLCYAKSLPLCPTLCDPIDGSLENPNLREKIRIPFSENPCRCLLSLHPW